MHLAEGNLAEARPAHELFRAMIDAELSVGPTEQMTRLVHDIRPRRPADH